MSHYFVTEWREKYGTQQLNSFSHSTPLSVLFIWYLTLSLPKKHSLGFQFSFPSHPPLPEISWPNKVSSTAISPFKLQSRFLQIFFFLILYPGTQQIRMAFMWNGYRSEERWHFPNLFPSQFYTLITDSCSIYRLTENVLPFKLSLSTVYTCYLMEKVQFVFTFLWSVNRIFFCSFRIREMQFKQKYLGSHVLFTGRKLAVKCGCVKKESLSVEGIRVFWDSWKTYKHRNWVGPRYDFYGVLCHGMASRGEATSSGSSWIPTTPAKPGSEKQQAIGTNWNENQAFQVYLQESERVNAGNQVTEVNLKESRRSLGDFLAESPFSNVPAYSSSNSACVSGGLPPWQAAEAVSSEVYSEVLCNFDTWQAEKTGSSHAGGYGKVSDFNHLANMSFSDLLALADAGANTAMSSSITSAQNTYNVQGGRLHPEFNCIPHTLWGKPLT